jgi:hypothetical protein
MDKNRGIDKNKGMTVCDSAGAFNAYAWTLVQLGHPSRNVHLKALVSSRVAWGAELITP